MKATNIRNISEALILKRSNLSSYTIKPKKYCLKQHKCAASKINIQLRILNLDSALMVLTLCITF